MTRTLNRTQQTLLGAALLGALVVTGWLFFAMPQRQAWSDAGVRVSAPFSDVGGLQVGTRVHLQGVDVGEVEAVELPDVAGQPVTVRLRLSASAAGRLGTDAQVKISRDNPIGERIVRLVPGTAESPRLADGAILAAAEAPDLFDGLSSATRKLNDVLKDLDASLKTLRAEDRTFVEDVAQSAKKLNVVLGKLDRSLAKVEAGEGTLGKLLKDETLYDDLTQAAKELRGGAVDARGLIASAKQNSDAIKSLPVVRSYVVDPNKELVRPDRKRVRKVFAEDELFEPGKAVLTDEGKTRLDSVADWLKTRPEGEVAVASVAGPAVDATFAQTLTKAQAEAVRDRLVRKGAHRTGWWWWDTRAIAAHGVGTQPPAQPEAEDLPPARVEVLLFLPANR